MNALLVTCHPYDRSFTYAIAEGVAQGLDEAGAHVDRLDLYSEEFDPVLTGAELARRYSLEPAVQRYIELVRQADYYVFVHPDWWSGPPALLKGWIERVFRPGIAYDWEGEEFQEKRHVPLLRGRSAHVFITSDRSGSDPAEALLNFWSDFCAYAGITLAEVRVFADMRSSSIRQRRTWLKSVRESVTRLPDQSAT